MSVQADTLTITAVLLVAARLAALLLFSPLFLSAAIPGTVRLVAVLVLATGIVASARVVPSAVPADLAGLGLAVVTELFVGAVLAFGVFCAFAAFQLGGQLLDFQMGFGVANVIDPATSAPAPLLGTALNLMAVAAFFALDGHHWLIRGFVYSLERVPPGATLPALDLEAVAAQFGVTFVYGVAVVAPAVITLFLIDVAMSVVARSMPQLNVFVLSLPLKIFVGLTVLALGLRVAGPLLERVYGSIFKYWDRVLS